MNKSKAFEIVKNCRFAKKGPFIKIAISKTKILMHQENKKT